MLDSIGHLIESVQPGETRPAVFAFEKLVTESDVQVVALRKVGDGLQAKALGQHARHRQGVCIVEADRWQHFQSEGGNRRVQVVECELFLGLENRLRKRARVLDVDIDLASDQRLVADQGAAQPHAALHLETRGLEQLRRRFPQNVRFVEVLARDDDGLGRDPPPPRAPGGRWRRGGSQLRLDQSGDIARPRCIEDCRGLTMLQDLAGSDDDQVLCQPDRLAHVVGDEQRADPLVLLRVHELLVCTSSMRVMGSTAENGSSRSSSPRFQHERPAEAHALLLAAGKLIRIAVRKGRVETHFLQQFREAGLDLLARPPLEPREQVDVLSHRHVGEQARPLHRVADCAGGTPRRAVRGTASPSTSTVPSFGRRTPFTSCSSVVLPLPLSPTMAVVWPDGHEKVMPRNTQWPAKCLPTPANLTQGAVMRGRGARVPVRTPAASPASRGPRRCCSGRSSTSRRYSATVRRLGCSLVSRSAM